MTSNSNKFVSVDAGSTQENPDSYFTGEYQHLPATRERKQNLLTYAKHNTKEDNIRINLSESADTASIQNYDGNDDKTVIITIPVDREVENPYVDIDDPEFYSMLQYAWTLHETGHYLYTDQPTADERRERLKEKLSDYPRPVQGILLQLGNRVWNAIEDGAMEEAVKNEKGPKAGQRLAVKNESFIAQGSDNADEERLQNLDVIDAIQTAAMDLAKYDTGSLRRLLDDTDDTHQFKSDEHRELFIDKILPVMQQGIIDVFTTASSVERQHVIWDLVENIVDVIIEQNDHDDIDEPSQQFGDMGDDTDNQSGAAQKQQSPGLQQKSKQEVAQQQANTTQQTVVIETDEPEETDESEESEDGEPENGETNQNGDGEQSGSGDQSGDGGEASKEDGEDGEASGQSDADGEQSDSEVGATEHGAGGADGDEELTCPKCGSDDVGRQTVTTDGMVAARVNAPFSIDAAWIDSISFVSDDEVCGFRVRTSGTVPVDSIEQQGYIVAEINNDTVEILEPADQYSDREQVNGFECDNCGNTWVPVIGGDGQ